MKPLETLPVLGFAICALWALPQAQAENIGPSHSTRYISTEKQYGPDVAPGINQQTDPAKPANGGRYSAQYLRCLDRKLRSFSLTGGKARWTASSVQSTSCGVAQ